MYRFFTFLVLAISLVSFTVIAQRDSGRRPALQRDPANRTGNTGGGEEVRIARPQPAPPRDNFNETGNSGGREHPVGHPERPAPRPNPPLQERPSPDPAPAPDPIPAPDPFYPEEPVEIYYPGGCYYCPPDEPLDPYFPYPSEEPTLKMKAINAFEDKHYLDALVLLTDAINDTPYDYELYFYRGVSNVKLDNYLWAIEDLDFYLEEYPENKVAWYYRGLANYYMNNKEEAYLDFDSAVKLGDPRAKIFLNRYF